MHDVFILKSKGLKCIKEGRFNEALDYFNKAIELNSNSAELWLYRGTCFGLLGKFDEEIKCYKKALEIDPNNPTAWCSLGAVLHHLGKFDEAIECYNKALELCPDYKIAIINKSLAILKERI